MSSQQASGGVTGGFGGGGGRGGGRGSKNRGGGGSGRGGRQGRGLATANSTKKGSGGGQRGSEQGGDKSGKNAKKQRPRKNRSRGQPGDKGGNNKNNNKPKISEEERKRLAEEERQAEERRKAEERAAQALKAQQAALEARRKEQKEREGAVREATELFKTAVVDMAKEHKASRTELETESLLAARKEFEASKRKLKTDVKKCTAFVKKVKSGSAWSMKPADIQRDVASLNLSRYVDEIVAALLESNYKVADIPIIVALCKSMHQRYKDFLPALLSGLWKVVHSKPNAETAKLRRIYVRLLTEFILSGLVTETKPLVKCVAEATGGKKDENGTANYVVQDANLVVAFSKAAGFEIFGVTPTSIRAAKATIKQEQARCNAAAAEQPQPQAASAESTENKDSPAPSSADAVEKGPSTMDVDEGPVLVTKEVMAEAVRMMDEAEISLKERAISPDASDVFCRHCVGAYQFLSKALVQTHTKLQKLEKRCEQDRLLSGSLTEAREKGLADARKLKESLQKSVEALSDVLHQPMPQLEEEDDEEQEAGLGVEVWTKDNGDGDNNFGPFDDEETRAFYCDIPDLLTTIPPALLGMTPETIERRKLENAEKYGENAEADLSEESDTSAAEVTPTSEAQLDAEEEGLTAVGSDDDEEEAEQDKGDDEENKDTPHFRLMVLLDQELPECHRREQIDEMTERFCTNHGSSKNSRKRLGKTLFNVPRSRLDLLPYYSRMTATLDRVWPDIALPLVTELEQQFHGQAKYKKNQNIDSRMKTARYIGELTKFGVAPPLVFLRCLRRCLDDFTGGNVDVACGLLESCGRYLYRMKHTTARVASLMDAMSRFSKAKNLDERLQSLIKAAFYSVKPPPTGPRKQAKKYSPLEAYLRYLLIIRLGHTDSSINFTTKQLVRFPWSDPSKQCAALICRIMLKSCRKGRYKTIQSIAQVAAHLRTQRLAGEVTVRLTDAVLEELRWALEHPSFRDQQRTLTYARLLGELYCASQVTAQIILHQLYDFINIGHEIPDSLRESSKRLVEAAYTTAESSVELDAPNSASGISQTIQEDEEMEDTALETTTEVNEPQPVAVSQYSKYDPRVPSPIDLPNSVYRVKLVCTLLEVVAKSILTRSNLPRMKGFITAFQRYLFTKTMLPTEVEFSLLDTFDILDSQWRRVTRSQSSRTKDGAGNRENGFPRYVSWIDAHNATIAFEESEALFEAQKRARLEGLVDESKSLAEIDDAMDHNSILNDDDTASIIDDDMSASVKDSVTEGHEDEMYMDDESCQHSAAGSEDEEADSVSEGETDEEDEEEEEEFDEEAYIRQLEEDAFERELRRVTMESLEKGKNASRKLVGESMVSGTQIIKKKPADQNQAADSASATPGPSMALGGKAGISFQLLKKGNKGKVEAKELVVPVDTNLAMVATKQDDKAARERDVIKQRVLQYEADSADAIGGNVYLEQERLQVIRNRPLSMDDIDRNFGTTGGNLLTNPTDKSKQNAPSTVRSNVQPSGVRSGISSGGRGGRGFSSGRGRGRGRGNAGGRTLFR